MNRRVQAHIRVCNPPDGACHVVGYSQCSEHQELNCINCKSYEICNCESLKVCVSWHGTSLYWALRGTGCHDALSVHWDGNWHSDLQLFFFFCFEILDHYILSSILILLYICLLSRETDSRWTFVNLSSLWDPVYSSACDCTYFTVLRPDLYGVFSSTLSRWNL